MIARLSTQNTHYNSKPTVPPSDFLISSLVNSSSLFYLSNTFSYIDLQPYFSLTITNSNEIFRNNNDIYITGNFGTQSYIFKLKDCKFIKNRLLFQGVEQNSIGSYITYIHGMAYINDYIYLSSRAPGGPPLTIAKIDSNNLQDISTLTLSVSGGTNDILGYKDNLYVLAAPSSIGTASFIRISPDLATHSVVFVSGTSSSPSRRVRQTSAFSIHNDEVYVPITNNTTGGYNQIGMQVFNLSGVLQRSIYNQTINSSASLVPLPHWMAFHNNKLIISNATMGGSSSHRSLVRMNPITLAVEESIIVPFLVTDDNSIFSDDYIYLNGELPSSYLLTPPVPGLVKVKYDNFTDFTTLISPFGPSGSYGSINPLSI
jgi:hypothetical protein